MGLEPMTSPLPRECSTTELHQPVYRTPKQQFCLKLFTLQSYRERKHPSVTRKAKNPKSTQVSD